MTKAAPGHSALFAAKPTLTAFWLFIQAVKRVILAARVGRAGRRSGFSFDQSARFGAPWLASASTMGDCWPSIFPTRAGQRSFRSPRSWKRRLRSCTARSAPKATPGRWTSRHSPPAAKPRRHSDIASLPPVPSSGSPQSPSAASRFLLANSAVAPTASSFSTRDNSAQARAVLVPTVRDLRQPAQRTRAERLRRELAAATVARGRWAHSRPAPARRR